jgi:RND superfamily putative drug exporter
MESVRGLERLAGMGRAEVALDLRAIVTLPRGTTVFDPLGWETIERIEGEIRADPRVADTRSIRTVSGGLPAADVRAVFPRAGLRSFTSRDESSALIEIVPERGTGAIDAAALVRNLRTAQSVVNLRIGGVAAHSADYAAAIVAHAVQAVGFAVVAAFVVLLVSFGSVLVAAKAVVLNLLTAVSAIGATVLVFQEGIAGTLFGASPPLGGIFATVPLLAFCTTFAIGLDYEVFLLTRIIAERRAGADDEEAIVRGVASSARLITRAAAIMIVVFAAFAFGDFIVVRMVGFALAVAVAIDATLVRLVIAPALMRIAGRWNWWPAERLAATNDAGIRRHTVQSAP